MTELMIVKLSATGIIMIGATAMIFARRYKNKDSEVGVGIAGWTIFIILIMWLN